MNQHRRRQWGTLFYLLAGLIVVAFLPTGCAAPRAYLIVDYPVPEASSQLAGREIRLQVIDGRGDRQVLTPAAQRQFTGFQDRYSLAWITAGRERILAGEKNLEELFLEAFRKRLTQMGAKVLTHDAPGVPLLQVLIDSFSIDLENQRWITSMRYEANLITGDRIVAKEMVSGESERVRVIGRRGADNNLSDIFTTVVNRLEITKMFQQARW
jgi:uncharacterized lipoprotein YajG